MHYHVELAVQHQTPKSQLTANLLKNPNLKAELENQVNNKLDITNENLEEYPGSSNPSVILIALSVINGPNGNEIYDSFSINC